MASKHSGGTKNTLRFCDVRKESGRNLPPIQGFENMPLVSLDAATEPLTKIVPQIKHMQSIAEQKCQESDKGLTYDEVASIKLYCMGWSPAESSFYAILNQTLRSESRAQLKPWFSYLRLVLNALSKLPSYTANSLFRGVKADLRAQYPKDSTTIWWGFTSCTATAAVLQNDQFLGTTGTRTLFVIDCSSGKDIRKHSFYPEEDEVLLSPGVQFRVISHLEMGSDLYMIHLKEIQPAFPLLATIPPTHSSTASTKSAASAALLDNLHMVRIGSALINKLASVSLTAEQNDSSADKHGSNQHTPAAHKNHLPHHHSPKIADHKSPSCVNCHQQISDSRYIRKDEHVYCIKCHDDRFANTCEECRRKISSDAKDLSYKERHWHEQCFFCCICRTSLVHNSFACKNEQIYCSECYEQKFALRCHECRQMFKTGAETVEHGGEQYHEHCFACSVCTKPIGTNGFITKDHKRFCIPCHEERFAKKCTSCHKPISQRIITYKNQPWHRDCFICTSCKTSLADQPIVSRDEQPYCTDCSARLFAKRCFACSNRLLVRGVHGMSVSKRDVGITIASCVIGVDAHWLVKD